MSYQQTSDDWKVATRNLNNSFPSHVRYENGELGYMVGDRWFGESELNNALVNAQIDLAIEKACLKGDMKALSSS
jgi:hypothetical protein